MKVSFKYVNNGKTVYGHRTFVGDSFDDVIAQLNAHCKTKEAEGFQVFVRILDCEF